MGIGPPDIQVGDHVVILAGAEVPFILRSAILAGPEVPLALRSRSESYDLDTWLQPVGETYVHSIMNRPFVFKGRLTYNTICLI